MTTFRPVMEEENVVRFNAIELKTLLNRLQESGAQEIGVSIRLQRR